MKTNLHLQDYWDKNLDIQNLGESFDAKRLDVEQEIAFWLTPDQQWVHRSLGSLQGKCIVDIGGGLSVNCVILARCGAEVIVADLSLERLRLLKKILQRCGLAEQVRLVCTSAEALALAGDCCDAALSKSVLIHTDLSAAVNEVRRILKPGATAFFTEPTTGNPLVNLYRRFFAPKEWEHITRYFSQDSLETIRQVFPGLEIKAFYLCSFPAFFWQFGLRSKLLFKFFLGLLSLPDRLLLSVFPSLASRCWFYAIKAPNKQPQAQ